MLIMSSAIDPPEKAPPGSRPRGDSASEDEDDREASSRMRSKVANTSARSQKNIRSSRDDSDSDFEFDI